MPQSLVIGNWKMHGSRAANQALVAALQQCLPVNGVQVVLCPPLLHIADVAAQLEDSPVLVGAQNLCAEAQQAGAYTGEVSAAQLADYGVRYVLVGHSERRALYHDNDDRVAQKFLQAQQAGLVPVLCVGEQLAEREAGQALAVITAQLQAVADKAGMAAFAAAVIAYEPVWAIGTGQTASPEQAQAVHAHIRQWLAADSAALAQQVPLLYGGSVNAGNAASLFLMADIDGALVGGASLKADEFCAICNAALE